MEPGKISGLGVCLIAMALGACTLSMESGAAADEAAVEAPDMDDLQSPGFGRTGDESRGRHA